MYSSATTAELPLLWLNRVAFRVIVSRRRDRDRRQRLVNRFGHLFTPMVLEAPDARFLTAPDAAEVVAALEILSPTDRDAEDSPMGPSSPGPA